MTLSFRVDLVTARPRDLGRNRAVANMNRLAASAQCVENDPEQTSAIPFANLPQRLTCLTHVRAAA